ncbi:MAG: transporter substrate-binding domain-containing protein [Actinomycetota bacterium]|nr:transporter substrate-binding domain-containing protein [Actinomycetota bacterium]
MLLCLALGLPLASCDFPADPEDTLADVRDGTLRVGVIENDPWVVLEPGKAPAGVEPELMREFAETLDAEIEWHEGSADELAPAVSGFQIDVLIGGLTADFPHPDDVAMTRPYIDTEIELGGPPGTDLPDDRDGLEVYVETASEAASLLRKKEHEAVPIPYETLSEVDGVVLANSYELEALGYEPTGDILRDEDHAMGVPPGENAFLIELEEFLLERKAHAAELLTEEASK